MFHGIEELVKDGEGYVYWRGTHVEHFSFGSALGMDDEDLERERAAALKIAARCVHLESIGAPVRSGTVVWHWDWFRDMQANDPLLPLLSLLPGLYERDDGYLLLKFAHAEKAVYWHRDHPATVESFNEEDLEFNVGRYSYHGLERNGYHILRAGQNEHCGACYIELASLRENFAQRALKVADVLALVH